MKTQSIMTQSLEDYIETIYLISKKNGGGACVCEVAQKLKVKMPSVVKAIRELKKYRLVTQEPYGDIELTNKGRRLACFIFRRHNLIKKFLMKLGVGEQNAELDACKMEHILTTETIDKIRTYTEG
jgi:DtxR family Mn-dependent transcriptional regulator